MYGIRVPATFDALSRRAVLLASLALTACGARSELGDLDAHGPCDASPAIPTLLTTVGSFETFRRPTAITVAGASVYYSVNDGSNDPLTIERLPVAGGAPTSILAGVPGCAASPFGYGPLVTDGTYLYTPDEEMVTTCTGESVHVTRLDPATSAVTMLPNPADGHPRGVGPVRTSAAYGVLWLSPVTFLDPQPGPTLLARWDGTHTSVVGAIPGTAFAFVIAGDQAFVQTRDTLYQLPLDGSGAPAAIATIGQHFQLSGSSGEGDAIFYTPDGTTLARRDVASGAERHLATGVGGNFDGNGDAIWTDGAWVYFVRAPGNELVRVPVAGGPVEVLSPDDTRDGVNGVVTDACNVYWLAAPSFTDSLSPAVYVRAR